MNKVFIIGRLSQDPELRTTPSGVSVCTMRIAVNRRFTNQAGERVADFFTVVAWRQLGENCSKHLAKGRLVSVLGELQNRSYDAKDGSKRYITEIIADEIEFLSPKADASGEKSAQTANQQNATPPSQNGGYAAAPSAQPPQAGNSYAAPAPNYGYEGFSMMGSFEGVDDADDTLPF